MSKTPAWQRKEGKSESGGLNEKGRASLRAEGHDIKRPQPEGGSRRDSFCARMKGMKAKLTSSETANDPDSRINKSLRAWNCADGGAVDPYNAVQKAASTDANAPYGVVDMGDKIIVGSPHGEQIPLSDDLRARIQDVAGKSGAWYEGAGGDIEKNRKLIPSYRGSWDDQVAKSVEGYPVEYIAPLFSNVDVNKPHEVFADSKSSIFDAILRNQGKMSYFKDRKFDQSTLSDFLSGGSEKGADFISMSKQPATSENLYKFFSTGEKLMWPDNWQEYPNRLGKMAKRFEESRNKYLLNAPPGVYVTGAGHIPELRGMNKDLKVIGGERAGEADGGAVDPYAAVQEAAKGGAIWDKPRPKNLGKPEHLSSKEKASAKAAAKAAGRPYPNLIDNMRAARADGGEADPYEAVQQAANPDDGMSRFTPEDINRAAHGATPAVPPLTVTENPAPASSVSDAVRGAYNAAVPPTARLFAESAMGVHNPITERDFSPSDIQNMRDRLTEQQQFNAGREKNLQAIQDTMTPEGYRHYQAMTDQPIGGNEDYRRYMAHNAEALKSFQDTRGQTSVPYGTTFGKEDQPNQPLSVYSPEQGNFLTSLQRSYTDPGYRTGMTLGRFNVYDTPQGRVAVDNYDFRGRKQSWSDVAKNFQEQPFVTALRGAIPTAFPNIDRPVAVNLDKPGNYTYTGKAILTPGSHLEPEQTQTPKRDDIADYRTKTPGFHQFNLAAINSRTPDVTVPLPPRRPAGYADGGEVIGDKVQGDVQFLEDDPYAKVQEAAKLPMMAQNDFAMRMPEPEVRYDTGPQPGEATLKGYDPTIKERIYQGIAGTEERPSPERAQFARGMSQMAEFAPVLGNVMAGQEAQRRGDTKGMLMAALPVPGMATEARMAEAAISPAEQAAREAYQRVLNAQGMYSHAAEAAYNLPQAKGSYEQMMAMLKSAGVKPEEMRWSGVEQFAGQPVTREQLASHFEQNLPKIEETVLGSPDETKLNEADAAVREAIRAYNEGQVAPRYYAHNPERSYASSFFPTREEAEAHIPTLPASYHAGTTVAEFPGKPIDVYETMRRLHNGEFVYNLPPGVNRAALNLIDERNALAEAAEQSGTKFGQYTLPGGQNYRELLLHTPGAKPEKEFVVTGSFPMTFASRAEAQDYIRKLEKMREEMPEIAPALDRHPINILEQDSPRTMRSDKDFHSSHWDQPNVLGHLRMSDRTGPEGEKILHLEELQSDWGQAGRKQGFETKEMKEAKDRASKEFNDYSKQLAEKYDLNPNQNLAMYGRLKNMDPSEVSKYEELQKIASEAGAFKSKTIPSAPYVEKTQNWVDLGLKRALKEAAEGGYHKMVWTPGEEQAARYDLSQQIGGITARPMLDGKIHLEALTPDMGSVIHMGVHNPNEIDDVIGKELADKIRNQIQFPKTESGYVVKNKRSGNQSNVYKTKEDAEDILKNYPEHLQKDLIVTEGSRATHGRAAEFRGLDLKVGGEGMKGFYDKIVPTRLKELLKKVDPQAKMSFTDLQTRDGVVKVPTLEITPKIREAVKRGLPAYADGGEVTGDVKPDPYADVQRAAMGDLAKQEAEKPSPLKGLMDIGTVGATYGLEKARERMENPFEPARQLVQQSVVEPAKSAYHIAAQSTGEEPFDPYTAVQHASNVAGALTLGAGAFERPAGSLAMGASRVKDPFPYFKGSILPGEYGSIASPYHSEAALREEAAKIAQKYHTPLEGRYVGQPGSYYSTAQPVAPLDVRPTIIGSPKSVGKGEITLQPTNQMTWEQFAKQGQGGTLINLAGDRMNFGRLTHINDQPLAWPVDLHAGPKYMREPNPGEVWANDPNAATGIRKAIASASEKGPVYGVYTPMGAQSVNSSHNMFESVMAQIPNAGISKADMKAFDKAIKSGKQVIGNTPKDVGKRNKAIELLKDWPGIANAKEAADFARTLPGVHRADIINMLEKGEWRDKGFPNIGVTRVAITDPDFLKTPNNLIGGRLVELSQTKPTKSAKQFTHASYPVETFGKYMGEIPMVQRQYAMPEIMKRYTKPTATGTIVHPYSPQNLGRASFRKLFETNVLQQPINQEFIDNVMMGLERQKEYGFKKGGKVVNKADPYDNIQEAAKISPRARRDSH